MQHFHNIEDAPPSPTTSERTSATPCVLNAAGLSDSEAARGDEPSRDRGNDRRDFLTLSQAARFVPGKTSPNAVWRWCRRGVLARSGERVHLQHVRLGGKLLTTRRWLDEFGERLAAADKTYFNLTQPQPRAPAAPIAAAPSTPADRRWRSTRTGARARSKSDTAAALAERHARVAAELDAEGL